MKWYKGWSEQAMIKDIINAGRKKPSHTKWCAAHLLALFPKGKCICKERKND